MTTALLLTLALSGVNLTPPPAPQSVAESPVLRRVVRRALARTQARWTAKKDVWEDHSSWENAWVVRNDFVAVRMAGSRWRVAGIAAGLDTMFQNFGTVLDSDYKPATPFVINIYPGLTEYNEFATSYGADHSSFYGSFYTSQVAERPVSSYAIANQVRLGMWVTHSAFHQYLDHAFSNTPPPWISEGLASFFEMYWAYDWVLERYDQIRAAGNLIPLRDLLSANLAAYASRPEDRFIQLGVLFSYLIQHREDTKTIVSDDGERAAPFVDYVRAYLTRNASATRMPLHQLFRADIDQLERELLAFEFPR